MLDGLVIPASDDASDEKLIADVTKYGLHVVGVFDDRGDTDGSHPDFCYSIGLYASYGQPEVLLMGLGFETAKEIINSVGEFAKSGGKIESTWLMVSSSKATKLFFDPSFKLMFGNIWATQCGSIKAWGPGHFRPSSLFGPPVLAYTLGIRGAQLVI